MDIDEQRSRRQNQKMEFKCAVIAACCDDDGDGSSAAGILSYTPIPKIDRDLIGTTSE